MANRRFVLANGRGLGLSAFGDPLATRLVILCHPAPGSGSFDPNPPVTSTWGVQLIGLDRPGYGGSDPLGDSERATIEHRADDIAEFLEHTEHIAAELSHTGHSRVGVVGWGMGAAVAMSLAARHPHRIDRLALLSAVAPLDDSVESSLPAAVENLFVSRHDTAESLTARIEELIPFGIEELGVSADDPALTRLGGLRRVERMLREADLRGAIGVVTDLVSRRDSTWATELGRITAETVLVTGENDPVAGSYDSAWFAKRIANARCATVRGSGRLAIADVWPRILQHVAPQRQRIPATFP